jgi:hypothetical protein
MRARRSNRAARRSPRPQILRAIAQTRNEFKAEQRTRPSLGGRHAREGFFPYYSSMSVF